MHESFWMLMQDKAHWEFEMFLMLLFDGVLAGVWKLYRRWQAKRVQDWSMNPIATAAGHRLETPEGICEGCGGVVKHLIESGIKWCWMGF
jgi:hypothetical protein